MDRQSVLIVAKQNAFRIGSKAFKTKAAAERHIREMFWRYPPMGALAGEDLEFALALIEMHPSRAIIVGPGIRSIEVQPVPWHEDQRRFKVTRTDTSWFDFSWRNALSPKSAARKLAGVLRHLIAEDVCRFKEEHFRGICETCGAPIEPEDCHVDHAYPFTFNRLMRDWLQFERLTAHDVTIVAQTGYEQYSYLEDSALAQSWREYHEINAQLRCVCRRCNLSTLRTSPR
jgi:hypothetical protein